MYLRFMSKLKQLQDCILIRHIQTSFQAVLMGQSPYMTLSKGTIRLINSTQSRIQLTNN